MNLKHERLLVLKKKKTVTVEMDALQRSYTISKLQHIKNKGIQKNTGLEQNIIEAIKKQRLLLWPGYLQRKQIRYPRKYYTRLQQKQEGK